jgi:hypothetical protein
MTRLPAQVIAIEKRGDPYQVIVRISTKYRGSFNTLAFGEIKPYCGSLKDGRLDLIYYRDPGLNDGKPLPSKGNNIPLGPDSLFRRLSSSALPIPN